MSGPGSLSNFASHTPHATRVPSRPAIPPGKEEAPYMMGAIRGPKSPNHDEFGRLLKPTGDGFLGVAWDELTIRQLQRLFTSEVGIGRALANSIFLSATTAVLGTLISVYLFDFQLTMQFAWGAGLVVLSAYAYATAPPPESEGASRQPPQEMVVAPAVEEEYKPITSDAGSNDSTDSAPAP